MPAVLLCALDLPPFHPLWQALDDLGYSVQRLEGPQGLDGLHAPPRGEAALVGPNLTPRQVARTACRTEQWGIPLVVVLPAGCMHLPVPLESPVYGYLPVDSGPNHVSAVLATAQQMYRRVADLDRRLQKLQADWDERKLVERAKGVLMARRGITEEEAHRLLRESSMRRRQRMVQVARAVLLDLAAVP